MELLDKDSYDGYGFRHFRSPSPDGTGLLPGYVQVIHEDRRGDLWLGTNNTGLYRYLHQEERFERFLLRFGEHGPSQPPIWSILEDSSGSLWIGTEAGLGVFDPGDGTVTPYPQAAAAPAGDGSVMALFEDSGGRFWVGTETGLCRLERSDGTFSCYGQEAGAADELRTIVHDICEDPRGGLWIASDGGLLHLDTDGGLAVFGGVEDRAIALHLDRRGDLWIGYEVEGLGRLESGSDEIAFSRHNPFDEESLGNDSILAIREDRTGLLWIAHYAGLDKLDHSREQFTTWRPRPGREHSLVSAATWALYEDSAGVLWVGTYEHGLDRIDRRTGEVTYYAPDPADPDALPQGTVSAVLEDHDGNFWIGTWGGLARLDRGSGTFSTLRHDGNDATSLPNDLVWTLYEDRTGGLWVGTLGGVALFNRASESFKRFPPGEEDPAAPGDLPVHAVLEDSDGVLWLASDGGGLVRRSPDGRFSRLRHDPEDPASLSIDNLAALLEDRRGRLWVGTYNAGLNLLDANGRRFRRYTTADGLPNDSIFAILEDEVGFLWLSTSRGLCRFDTDEGSIQVFDADDGVQGFVFTSGSFFLSPSTEMFFGGVEGFNSFFPGEITSNPDPPRTVLTDFRLFHESVRPRWIDPSSPLEESIVTAREVVLSHRDYVLTVEFAALHYANPRQNGFVYRLDGFDDDWREPRPGQPAAQYSNLAPGSYVFRVKSSNHDGVWSDEEATVSIVVRPPPWKTWWAKSLYGLTIAGALWGYAWAQRRKFLDERAISLRLDSQAKEVKARIAELRQINYTLAHDLRSPLVTITSFLGFLRRRFKDGDADGFDQDSRQIREAARLMHRLLDDLFEVSELGDGLGDFKEVPLREVALEAVKALATPIAERGAEVEVAARLPTVLGNRDRLRQVLLHLLKNALGFLSEEPAPRIVIGTRAQDCGCVVFCQDNGLGIEPRYHSVVFGLFEQLDPQAAGTGFGLYLAKRIVELHGGRIWVESEGKGKGTRFCISLPQPPGAGSPR